MYTNESHPWSQVADAYIALGDFYSSGEGAGSYLPGTNGPPGNLCHDFRFAYGVRAAAKLGYLSFPGGRFGFKACSGAVVHDVTPGPPNPGQWDPVQLTYVNSRDNLVSISIGGNDVGFSSLTSACFTDWFQTMANIAITAYNAIVPAAYSTTPYSIASCVGEGSAFQTALNYLKNGGNPNGDPSLTQLYQMIAARAAPHAQIRVMLYPPILPPSGITPGTYCAIPVSIPAPGASVTATLSAGPASTTIRLLNKMTFLPMPASVVNDLALAELQLNAAIKAAVAATGNPNIVAVNPAPGFNGRWFCNGPYTTYKLWFTVSTLTGTVPVPIPITVKTNTSEPYITPLMLTSPLAINVAASASICGFSICTTSSATINGQNASTLNLAGLIDQQSFHPTAKGQAQMAQAFLQTMSTSP